MHQGELTSAAEILQGLAADEPASAEAFYNLGVTLKQMDRLEDAEAALRRAIDLDPKLGDARFTLGVLLWQTGRTGDAERTFGEAISATPRSADAHYMLGTVLRQQGRRDEAIAEFRQAIQFDPDLAEAHHSLAQALQQQGDGPAARVAQAEADRLNRRKADAQASTFAVGVGQDMLKRGDRAGAIAQFREAVRLAGDNAAAHQALAQALQQAGAVQEAKRHFDEARKLSRRTRGPGTSR
jgi:tetratricopeptide (TPR) repeat protein